MNTHIYSHGENLFLNPTNAFETNRYINNVGNEETGANGDKFFCYQLNAKASTDYTFIWDKIVVGSQDNYPYIRVAMYNGSTFVRREVISTLGLSINKATITTDANIDNIDVRYDYKASRGQTVIGLRLFEGNGDLKWRDYTPHIYQGVWKDGTSYSYDKISFDLTGTDTDNGYVDEYFLKSDGSQNLSTTGLWAITEYQEIPDGVSKLAIKTNGNTNAAICFYKSTKTFISGTSYINASSQAVDIPPHGAKYFRMSIKKDEISSFVAKTYSDVWNP